MHNLNWTKIGGIMKIYNIAISLSIIALLFGCSDPAKCVFSVRSLNMKTIEQGEKGAISFVIYNRGERKLNDSLICSDSTIEISSRKIEINPGDSVIIDITVNGDKIGSHKCEVMNVDSTCAVLIDYKVDYVLNEKMIEQMINGRSDKYIQSSSMWMLNTFIGNGGDNGYAFGFNCDKKFVDIGVKNGILRYIGTSNGDRHYCSLTSKAKEKYQNGTEYVLNRVGKIKVVRFIINDETRAEAEVEITIQNNEIGAAYWGEDFKIIKEVIYFKKWNDGWKISS